jgi:hypothetical protein
MTLLNECVIKGFHDVHTYLNGTYISVSNVSVTYFIKSFLVLLTLDHFFRFYQTTRRLLESSFCQRFTECPKRVSKSANFSGDKNWLEPMICGGEFLEPRSYDSNCYTFRNGGWLLSARMTEEKAYTSSVVTSKGMFVFGGYNEQALDSIEKFSDDE